MPYESITLYKDFHNLIRIPNKRIASGEVASADIYTFEISPYELLPVARVYRRDELPSLSSSEDEDYQRPLIPEKLEIIRNKLHESPDFMFPNNILVVLSSDCKFVDGEQILVIPKRYGAIEVIDGQHRLLAYADESLKSFYEATYGEDFEKRIKIMVTAVQFQDVADEDVHRYSARAFVEINMTQTPVSSTHLYAIAYPILGMTDPKAIAAQIIIEVNERSGSRLYGLFDISQTTQLGIFKPITVLTALKTITNLERIQRLQNAKSGSPLRRKCGYENLFEVPVDKLSDPEILIRQGVVCFERYFNHVAAIFQHDWPQRGASRGSSLEYTKMIAGFVKLLNQFISEGLDWNVVQEELSKIKDNIMQLRGMSTYDAILFDPAHSDIPDAQPSATDDYRFLHANRKHPTSIQDILAKKHKS